MATPPFPSNLPKLFPNYSNLGAQLESMMNLQRSDSPMTVPGVSGNMNLPTTQPQSFEEIDNMFKQGLITREQADQLELTITNQPTAQQANDSMINPDGSLVASSDQMSRYGTQPRGIPPLNFAGSDLTTELFSLGASIGAPKGSQGRVAGIVGASGAAGLGIARDLLSGLGYQKATNYATDYYEQQRQKQQYTPNPQSVNDNYLGGIPTGKYGGLFTYQDGGPVMPSPDELERLRQLDMQYSQVNGTQFGLEGTSLLTDPRELAQFEQQYGSSLQGKRVWVNPQTGGSYVVDANPLDQTGVPPAPPKPKTVVNEGPISGTKKFSITGFGTGAEDQKSKITAVNVPYTSREELDQIERQMRSIKTYEDYKNSGLYQRYGDKLLGGQGAGGFRDGGTFLKQVGDKITFKHGGVMKSGTIKKIDLETGKFYI